LSLSLAALGQNRNLIGKEVSIGRHLKNGEEFELSIRNLVSYGEKLFRANWTIQEGAGRPLGKGTGAPVSDASSPLVFPRNFNRVSGPEANSCAGCHNQPFVGGGGDRATEVFVLGQRFDFATFDRSDSITTRGALAENGQFAVLQDIANERKTVSMNGSGFIEMLARQMTGKLQALRDSIQAGGSQSLQTNGVSFGVLSRAADGSWDTSRVEGLPAPSLATTDAAHPPSLIIMPFQQAGAVVSLRQFTNNAFNHHHGMQSSERFGSGVDADGDGFADELTRADITAVTVFQATLPVPGQIVPDDVAVEEAVRKGGRLFQQAGCASCHVPSLPLYDKAWIYSEPNPYNPAGNLRLGDAPPLKVDLTSEQLPGPRLRPDAKGIVWVPAFTDLKLHNITSGPSDPNAESLDQNQSPTSKGFTAGNQFFLTRKLWGMANSGPFMHHGKFTTIREAIGAHAGEALTSRQAFDSLSAGDRDAIIEYLKTFKVLPPGTYDLAIRSHEDDRD